MGYEAALDQIVSDYERDGVVRIHSLFPKDEIDTIREVISRYGRDVAPDLPDGDIVYESDGKTIRNLWRLEEYSQFFADLAHRSDLLNLAEKLVHVGRF